MFYLPPAPPFREGGKRYELQTIKLALGIMVLALALLACNLPGGESAAPTATVEQPPVATVATITVAPPESGDCPSVNLTPSPSGLIEKVTMAEDTSGEERNPVNPTSTYAGSATCHAVVALGEAPANTTLRAVWFAADTFGVADCNTQINAYELTTDGTRNIDFSLTPESTWPPGSYRIEVYVNNVLDQAVTFAVK